MTTKTPKEIIERVGRIQEFHRNTKLDAAFELPVPDSDPPPEAFRIFDGYSKIPLPKNLINASAATIRLLQFGLETLPDSQIQPPQNLQTLASWLFMAGGIIQRVKGSRPIWLRTVPSEALTYPCEIYVAAFAIDGLEPGLYHYSVKDYSLRKLREGAATLAHMKRGRPDLEFIKTTPGVLLVSSIFCRSSWRFHDRGYRHALIDTGHMVQNLWNVGLALGIQPLVRLSVHAQTMRELIGVPQDSEFGNAEAVQSMIVWAETASKPMITTAGAAYKPGDLQPIARTPLAPNLTDYSAIINVQEDCTAPGVAVREVRPPLTEMSVLSAEFRVEDFPQGEDTEWGAGIGKMLLTNTPVRELHRGSVSRNHFSLLNNLAFRWGSAFPLYPDGPHVALVRPIWMIHEVTGVEAGIWYYNPQKGGWSSLRYGKTRAETQQLVCGRSMYGNCAAACFLVANTHRLMMESGPDLYRLALIEAGTAAHRFYLAASSLGLGLHMTGTFFDDDIRRFIGIERTGWEVLYAMALGQRTPNANVGVQTAKDEDKIWVG
jgi:SagB-type dehydrogenase family enzyme